MQRGATVAGLERFLLAFALAAAIAASAAAACEPSSESAPAFPLRVQQGERHPVDAKGRPFFMHGDTAWSLIADLTREDAELYLRDRAARGFNTILVSLIEARYARQAPANAYGEQPFLAPGGFGTPNERYFAHADRVLRRACEHGMVVLLTPAYAGYAGGPDGWYEQVREAGPALMAEYGRFLGRRFGDLDNIVWVASGDYDPADKALYTALMEGLRETDPDALQTSHNAPETVVQDFWAGEPWLSLNNVYTYGPVYGPSLRQYLRPDPLPFFLMESAYENEHGAGGARVRMQAYQAILNGAFGHVYGNNPIWHFDGPGLYPVGSSWQDQLGSPGARSMTVLRELISHIPWWLLEPDRDGSFLVEGFGDPGARAVAAVARDGSLALVYLPTARPVTLDLARLSGPVVAARWHDPSNGLMIPLEPEDLAGATPSLSPPGKNAEGSSDWLLELRAADPGAVAN